MSLQSRARFVQQITGISFQGAENAIRLLGVRTSELSKVTGVPLKYTDLVLIREAELVEQVRRVQEVQPDLTAFGLGVFDRNRKPPEQVAAEIQAGREEMFGGKELLNFLFCQDWLNLMERTKRPTTGHDSYGHKHRVERWLGAFKGFGCHVSNGMFIAAAIHKGFEIQPVNPGSPNCHLNIRSSSATSLDEESKMIEALRQLAYVATTNGPGFRRTFAIDGVPVVGPRGPESVQELCGISPSRFKELCLSGEWERGTGHAPFPPRDEIATSTWYAPVASLESARRLWSGKHLAAYGLLGE